MLYEIISIVLALAFIECTFILLTALLKKTLGFFMTKTVSIIIGSTIGIGIYNLMKNFNLSFDWNKLFSILGYTFIVLIFVIVLIVFYMLNKKLWNVINK